ncbi:hypothetical protein ILYODFUR_036040 [Ilyodon furcidens]|uniref:Uncharacterized protein n=1 Tax=Ilyodon furcidens TaxID=33524 RepID=A0ABV0UY11_9TELE
MNSLKYEASLNQNLVYSSRNVERIYHLDFQHDRGPTTYCQIYTQITFLLLKECNQINGWIFLKFSALYYAATMNDTFPGLIIKHSSLFQQTLTDNLLQISGSGFGIAEQTDELRGRCHRTNTQ